MQHAWRMPSQGGGAMASGSSVHDAGLRKPFRSMRGQEIHLLTVTVAMERAIMASRQGRWERPHGCVQPAS
jgi:hypothetical protein